MPAVVTGAEDAATGTDIGDNCSDDSQCAGGFCDRSVCASATPIETGGLAKWYGRECSGVLVIGQYGTTFAADPSCSPGYMCMAGRCRSCVSSRECYETNGSLFCSASDGRPGKQCRDTPRGAELPYSPPEPAIRPGRAVGAVDQESGTPTELTLTVPAMGGVANARLAVVFWHQRATETDEFMHIAYDVPLALSQSGEAAVRLPFSAIAAPYEENLICFRRCVDRSVCDCDGLPEIAIGSIVVSLDSDMSGALSIDEVRTEQIGGTPTFIGWSSAHQTGGTRGFNVITGPVFAGFGAYVRDATGGLVPAADAGALSLCAPGDSACSLPIDRILCHRDGCERQLGLDRIGL